MNAGRRVARRQFLRVATGLAALGGLGSVGAGAGASGLHWDRRLLVGFGSTLSIEAGDGDASRLGRALDAAVVALQRI